MHILYANLPLVKASALEKNSYMVSEKFTFGMSSDAKMIRQEVFVEEQGFQNEFEEKDFRLWTLVLYLDGEPISTGRIEPLDPERFQIGRVAVRKKYRGMKVGTYTMKYLANKILSLGGRIAIVHAQIDKMRFYYSLGFREDKEIPHEYDEGVEHVVMRKVLKKL